MSSDKALSAAQPAAAKAAVENRAGVWGPRIALVVIVLAMSMRPGDAPWINDEPRLIEFALKFSGRPSDLLFIHLSFTPAQFGLQGTRGAWYGPAPVWFYQVLLGFTHNPLALVMLHALIVGGLTAAGLYWLARVMRVSPWLVVVAMLSPWLWHYSRQLWDNSFNIPLSALLLAAYGDFLSTRRRWSLRLVIFCALVMPLVHFMAAAMVGPVIVHLLVFHFRSVLKSKWSLLGIFVAIQVFAWHYYVYLQDHYHPRVPLQTSTIAGWFYPLMGAHHMAAAGLGNILGDRWFDSLGSAASALVFVGQTATLLIHPICWIGMGLAGMRAAKSFRGGVEISVVDHLCAVCLGIWICQSLLDGVEHAYDGPHYYNATWIAYVFFVWLAIEKLMRRRADGRLIGGLVLGSYAAALMVVLAAAEVKIVRDGGSKSLGYGTTLNEQIGAIREIDRYSPDSPRIVDLPQWASFSWTFNVLHELVSRPSSSPKPVATLHIGYLDPAGADARIRVEAVSNR